MNDFVMNTFSFGLVVPKYPEIPTNVNSSAKFRQSLSTFGHNKIVIIQITLLVIKFQIYRFTSLHIIQNMFNGIWQQYVNATKSAELFYSQLNVHSYDTMKKRFFCVLFDLHYLNIRFTENLTTLNSQNAVMLCEL